MKMAQGKFIYSRFL